MHRKVHWCVLGMLIVAATSLVARADPPAPSAARGETVTQGAKASVVKAFGTSPLRFEANQGQAGQGVKFLSRGKGYSLHLSPKGATFSLHKRVKTEGAKSGISETAPRHPGHPRLRARSTGFEIKTSTIKMGFAGANPNPRMIGEDRLVTKTNYQVGNDPAKWQLGVVNYAKVRYAGIYPGIDLVYHGNQRKVEYDFIVQPGADPKVIRLAFSGMEAMAVEAGKLVLQTPHGPVIQQAPVVYQEINGRRIEVAGTYALFEDNQVGFAIGDYDAGKPLVIDPVILVWTRYYTGGDFPAPFNVSPYTDGTGYEEFNEVALDGAGNAYVVGYIDADGVFPNLPPSDQDILVVKLDTNGNVLWQTITGSVGQDFSLGGIVVDATNNAYITGSTRGVDWPFADTSDGTGPGPFCCPQQAFMTKLAPTGAVIYSKIFANGTESFNQSWGLDLALDASGKLYVTGRTGNPVAPSDWDAFIARFTDPGTGVAPTLDWFTGFGGHQIGGADASGAFDDGWAVAVDSTGRAYVAGWTNADDFPGAAVGVNTDPDPGNEDAFLARFDTSGAINKAWYLGGTNSEIAHGVVVDSADNVYVTGYTRSTDFAADLIAPFGVHPGSESWFLVSMDASDVIHQVQFIGRGRAYGIAVDASDNLFIMGEAGTLDFPLAGPGTSPGDAIVAKLNTSAFFPVPFPGLEAAIRVGGSGRDRAGSGGLAVDASGNVFIPGHTTSTDFPNALNGDPDTTLGDAFVAKILFSNPGNMAVTPLTAVIFEGPLGGPFKSEFNCPGIDCELLDSRDYNLENRGDDAIDYTVGRNQIWIDLAPSADAGVTSAGTLAAGSNTDVTVSINTNANSLCANTYSGTTVFTNLFNGSGNTSRAIFLKVNPAESNPPEFIVSGTATSTLPDFVAFATGPLTPVVVPEPTVIDDGPGPITITRSDPGPYPVGTTALTWTATDCSGNQATASQNVVIIDSDGPVVTVPPPVTIEATATLMLINQAMLEPGESATAIDAVDGEIIPQPLIGPNTKLPLGTHEIGWFATDSDGNFTIEFQTVTIVDTSPPFLTIPGDVTVSAATEPVAVAIGTATAVDSNGVDPNPVVTRIPTITSFPFGTTEIRWKATDASGNSSSEQIQRIRVIAPVSLAGIEVIQVVQDMNNIVPLFAGKKTLVRAYFESSDVKTPSIWPKLIGFRNGAPLPEVLSPTNFDQQTIARLNVLSLRANETRPPRIKNLAANFELPGSWTQFGTTKLQLTFTDSRNPVTTCAGAVGPVTDACEVSVRFGTTAPIEVKLIPVGYYDAAGTLLLPSNNDVQNITKRLIATFPVKNVSLINGSTLVFHFLLMDYLGIPRKPTLETINDNLQEIREDDNCYTFLGCNRIYYGVLNKNFPASGETGGSSSGWWETASGTALDDDSTGFPGNHEYRFISSHEMAHAIKFPHPFFRTFSEGPVGPCGADSDADEPRFPYTYLDIPDIPKAVFGTFLDLSVGDTRGGRVGALGPLPDYTPCGQCPTFVGDDRVILGYDSFRDRHISPLTNFELMSYCGPRFTWPSRITYKKLASRVCDWFEKNCVIFPSGAASSSSQVAAANMSLSLGGPALGSPGTLSLLSVPSHSLIGGFISKTTMEVFFNPIVTLVEPSAIPPSMPMGDYTLRLLDVIGNVLGEVSFGPIISHLDPTNDEPDKTFLIPVLFDPNLYEVQIIKDAEVLGSIEASANAPTVKVIFPNGGETLSGDTVTIKWTAKDADNDLLFFNVKFSPDGGGTWQTLAQNHVETSLTVDMKLLSESTNGIIQVQAKDGFLTGTDTSDGAFSTSNSAPTVIILAPTPYQVYGGTQTINLKGMANDLEDQFLSDGGYAWSSNIDGPLGTGADFSLLSSTLTTGKHQITLTGTDSGGASGTDTVEIIVVGEVFPPIIVTNVATNPNTLWPPNHKMVPITVVPTTVAMPELDLDNVDCQITGITSNEPVDGKGAGKKKVDWVITGPLTADVRAERAGGGQGREYAITIACTAMDGATPHTATETGIVSVPHDE